MKYYFKITLEEPILPATAEKIEDLLKDLFVAEGLEVSIYDSVTGNDTKSFNEEEE